jgi:hypothetical protein
MADVTDLTYNENFIIYRPEQAQGQVKMLLRRLVSAIGDLTFQLIFANIFYPLPASRLEFLICRWIVPIPRQ